MSARTRALYRLQEIDMDIVQKESKFRDISQSLHDSPVVRAAKEAAEAAREQENQLRRDHRTIDMDIKALGTRISEAEDNLYSGKVRNPRELTDLQENIASLRRRKSDLEEQSLQMLVKADEAGDLVQARQAQLETAEANWEREQEELRQRLILVEQELGELREEREAQSELILPGDMAQYEKLVQTKGEMAIVLLKDSVCYGCRVALPSAKVKEAASSSGLPTCDTCGRILHPVS
ncbi:MAG: hypothetical protein HY326_10400 [Chloroflexi bacterium]|nr:hypothetical protein [Chloroflexota bacterium]